MRGAVSSVMALVVGLSCAHRTAVPSSDGDYVYIPGGVYVDDEGKEHRVSAVWMERTEVTVRAYRECVRAGVCPDRVYSALPMEFKNMGPAKRVRDKLDCTYHRLNKSLPMSCLSAAEAETYCRWRGGRLPTVWEWQWAASGRDERRQYPWGDEPPDCERAVMSDITAPVTGCGRRRPWPVGSKPAGASRDGLLDMAGNVDEFLVDPESGGYQTCGGNWEDVSPVQALRPTYCWQKRVRAAQDSGSWEFGFRCVRDVETRPHPEGGVPGSRDPNPKGMSPHQPDRGRE